MKEFYQDYATQLLKKIFEELKKGNKENIKGYARELKQLNITRFLERN